MAHSRLRFVLVLAALAAFGCQAKFTPASAVQGLRVLAVRQDPASGSPGATVSLDMLVADNRPSTIADDGTLVAPAVQVAWVAGCHNPPSRQYFACAPALRAVAANPDALTSGLIGTGTHFEVTLPDDILSAAPMLPTDPVHFGVSYVFFAACSGQIVPGGSDGFPFGCVDDAGRAIGPSGFVIGFTTIYSYAGAENQNTNPVLTGLDFDGKPALATSIDPLDETTDGNSAPVMCMTDDDCAAVTFSHPARCSANRLCAPLVAKCVTAPCPSYRVTPRYDPASVEEFTGGYEIMWASYYSTFGSFDVSTRLVVDRSSGPTGDYAAFFTATTSDASADPVTSRIWVTLNDQRGGATWAYFDVVME
jgi:hypothetical protein